MPRVYDSLLVLLDAVHLYRVYRQLDTLPLYLHYELLLYPCVMLQLLATYEIPYYEMLVYMFFCVRHCVILCASQDSFVVCANWL